MQACIYEEYGAPDVVRLAEVDRPGIAADELLIRVRAASVTTADLRFRALDFPRAFALLGRLWLGWHRPRKPILGMDFAGVVEATGHEVSKFRVGDRVFGSASANRRGAHAEYIAVRESDPIIHTPASLSDDQAAAIPFGANTALAFMRDFARVTPGQRVLIIGASGGVGVWAVQLARHLGAEVTGVCSARNLELVRELGAHHVVDHAAGPLLRDGQSYDLIFDTIGVTSFAACQHALTERGVFMPLNSDLREILDAITSAWSQGKKTKYAVSSNTREGLEQIAGLIDAGTLKPVVDRVYAMQEIVAAHRHVDTRHKRGSVVISMTTPATMTP